MMPQLTENQLAQRNNILALEAAMLKEPQLTLEIRHYFAQGTYTREMFIPAGTLLTGKIHVNSTINIMTKGRIEVATENGSTILEGSNVFVSAPGIKKAAFALEDTVWINVFPWDGEMTVEQLENTLGVTSYDALEAPCP
jgi:hypothetical protein